MRKEEGRGRKQRRRWREREKSLKESRPSALPFCPLGELWGEGCVFRTLREACSFPKCGHLPSNIYRCTFSISQMQVNLAAKGLKQVRGLYTYPPFFLSFIFFYVPSPMNLDQLRNSRFAQLSQVIGIAPMTPSKRRKNKNQLITNHKGSLKTKTAT